MSQQQQKSNVGATVLVFLPVVVAGALMGWIAWAAARAGASYRVTQWLLAPLTWFLSQLIAVTLFVCFGWVVALLCGSSDMANYVVGKASELALVSQMFGDPVTVPTWHIAVYQFVVWCFLVVPIWRGLTTGIFDSAIVSAALRDGVHPHYRRQHKIDTDKDYAESCAFYSKYRTAPQLGVILIFISRCPVNEYYT